MDLNELAAKCLATVNQMPPTTSRTVFYAEETVIAAMVAFCIEQNEESARKIEVLDRALNVTREALCEHACHAGPEVPCIRTRDQCATECGRSAGDVIVAVDRILSPGAACAALRARSQAASQ